MNLVLGVGAGYREPIFERFFGTLRASGYRDDIAVAVLASDDIPEVRQVFDKHSAQLIAYPETPIIPVCARFLIFQSILSTQQDRYKDGMVLHADVRDVVFQNNPFEFSFPPEHELFLALEEGLLGESEYDCDWIREGFGEAVLEQLRAKRTACCGTTMGTYRAMRSYVELMCGMIFGDQLSTGVTHALRNDQGVHNYLYYTGALDTWNPLGLRNDSGLFLTLGLPKTAEIDLHGAFLSPNRLKSSIVHQIDRLPSGVLAELSKIVSYPILDIVALSMLREKARERNSGA